MRHVLAREIGPTPDFLGDVGGDIGRPVLRRVEGGHQDGVVVLAGHEVGEDGFKIGLIDVSLSPDPAQVSEIIEDQVDGLIWPSGTIDGVHA